MADKRFGFILHNDSDKSAEFIQLAFVTMFPNTYIVVGKVDKRSWLLTKMLVLVYVKISLFIKHQTLYLLNQKLIFISYKSGTCKYILP